MKRVLPWILALGVAVGYGPAWAQEKEGEKKQEEGEKPAPKKREGAEGERKEGDRPAPKRREGAEGERKEGEKPAPRRREGGEGDRKEGEKPAPKREGGEGDRKEGEKPAVRRDGEGERKEGPRDGEAPKVRREGEGERKEGPRDGDAPRARREGEGERPVRRDGDPRPAREGGEVVKAAPLGSPIPVDEKVVPKSEAQPSFVGRVLSVFKDGVNTLVTLRVPGRTPGEVPLQIQPTTTVTYYGLEKPQEQPTVGYLAYVWLRPGSTDAASAVRFTAEQK